MAVFAKSTLAPPMARGEELETFRPSSFWKDGRVELSLSLSLKFQGGYWKRYPKGTFLGGVEGT